MENEDDLNSTFLKTTTKNQKLTSVKHRVIRTKEDFDKLEEDWSLLCKQTESHIFQTFDWNRTWWDHFGTYGELQIFVLYDKETVVGIAPLFCDRFTVLGVEMYVYLRMIGSRVNKTEGGMLLGETAYSDYLQFLIHNDYIIYFYDHFLFFLKYEVKFDELILEEVPELSTTFTILDNNFSLPGYTLDTINASKSLQILPEKKWSHYLKKLTVKERSNVRRALKTLKEGDKKLFRVEHLNDKNKFKANLNRFVELHQNQWREQGLAGTFGEFPMYNFFIEISEKMHGKGYLQISAVFPKEEQGIEHCLAIDVLIVYNERFYGQHRALNTSSTYYRNAPGKVLLMATVLEAVKREMTFDFMRGNEIYKQRLATNVNQNKTIHIFDSSGHQKLYKWFIISVQTIQKKVLVERIRMQVIMSQNKSEPTIIRYANFLLERISKRL